jgi:hypothetical protein
LLFPLKAGIQHSNRASAFLVGARHYTLDARLHGHDRLCPINFTEATQKIIPEIKYGLEYFPHNDIFVGYGKISR